MNVKRKKNDNRIEPEHNRFLTSSKEDEVIGIECNYYRVINDRDDKRLGLDPVLYSPNLFDIVDATEPSSWGARIDNGWRYGYPQELNTRGFWKRLNHSEHI